MTEVACSTWGDPVEMTPAMESVGQVQLRNSGGRPAAVRGADGVTYLFQMESGELTMRPCAAMSSTLGDAASPLYFAYVTQPGAAGWVALSPTWQTVDQLIDTMSRTIVGNPAAPFEFGGYLWDGQAMRWQSLASLVARRVVA